MSRPSSSELEKLRRPKTPPKELAIHFATAGVAFAIIVAALFGGFWLISALGRVLSYEATWEWWATAYLVLGGILATIASVVGFGLIWWAAAEKWGGICFVLGWLPAGIIAVIAWPLVLFLWGIPVAIWVVVGVVRSILEDLRAGRAQ